MHRLQPIDTEWFTRRLEKTGLSMRAIALRSNGAFSVSTLCRFVKGQKPLNLAVTIALAAAFDVSMEEIVRRAGYRPPLR